MTGSTLYIVLVIATVLLLAVIVAVLFLLSRSRSAKETSIKPAPAEASANTSLVATTEMATSFRGAMNLLQERTGDADFKYVLPWYLLIGSSASGKSALLAESSLASEITDQVQVEQGAGITWNFLPEGVLLDVAGDWSFGNGASATATWRRLMMMLRRHRPERPIDGVVVTLSAKDLIGPAALEPSTLVERATYLQQRLRQIQSDAGLRLPVYIVITHADSIDGFRELAHALTAEQRDEMFGWSNPYSADLQFRGEWTDVALAEMRIALDYRIQQIFAVEEWTRSHDAMSLLPVNLLGLQPRLKVFLSRALRSSGNVPEPFFRGIFLTGMLPDDLWQTQRPRASFAAVPHAAAPMRSNLPRATFIDTGYMKGGHDSSRGFDWGALAATGVPEMVTRWPGETARIVYVRDLVLRRIFPERTLAVPLANSFQSRDKTRRILQWTSAGLAAVFLIGMIVGYRNMVATRDRLLPLLTNVANDMRMRAMDAPSLADDAVIQTPTDDLIRVTLQAADSRVHSIFYPSSWGSPLDASVQEAIAPAFRVLVLERFERQLERKAAQITSADVLQQGSPAVVVKPDDPSGSGRSPVALEDLPSYRIQQHFVDGLLNLQQHVNLYTRLSTPGSGAGLQEVVELDAYLNNRPEVTLPTDATSPAFEQAIAGAPWRPFRYTPVDERNAVQRFRDMNTLLLSDAIENNPVRFAGETLVIALRKISGKGQPSYEDIRAAQRAFSDLNNVLRRPDLAWVGSNEFRMPTALYHVTLEPIGQTPYLPSSLRPTMQQDAEDAFRRMSDALNGLQAPQSGALLTSNGGRLQLTPKAQEVQLGLENLLSLSFVTPIDPVTASLAPGNSSTDWNKAALQEAMKLPDALRRYMAESLQQAPPSLQSSLGAIARERAGVAMESAVAHAQISGPALPSSPSLAEIQPAIQRFTAAAPTLNDVLATMRANGLNGPYMRLRAVADEQALSLLSALDRSFNAQNLYGISPAALERWNGKVDPAAALLGSSGEELPAFLAAERERVRAYGNTADPAVQFLLANGDNSRLPRRWQQIAIELRQYDAKRPGNSVHTLEDFIASDLPKLRIDAACSSAPFRGNNSDYFQQTVVTLSSEVRARCEALRGSGEASAWDAVVARFDGELAGRYPFADLNASSAVEVDPSSIGQFYALLDVYQSLRRGSIPSGPQRIFAEELTQAKPFFLAINSKPSNTIDFIPHFRAERSRETGGNQVAEWTLQIGNDSFRSGDPERKGSWSLGQPVTLSLRWAKNAAFVPKDISGPGMNANAQGVTYRFSDAWALLRLAQTLAIPVHDPAYSGDPNLLMIRIPERGVQTLAGIQTATIAEAKVFLRLDFLASGKPDAVAMPTLPLPNAAPQHAASRRGDAR